ncbi:exodeoxyribonuclease VII large subunit [Enterovirga aerilata]|uniref:Exodeoxyribonuclease 7 large subunit n=1 Tax=Enterovirga aerilata TaxID=2730920 RepID=A0A849IA63_9HYPH|nr:exodeoxyribonuclease VII large subunit [Enterovirga sp. DB1703]NNM72960.1 exodeoxyribonuclease VII large subunit [Enterovirga sp. DB1703]
MIPAAAEPTNAPEWTVSELSGALKRTLEDAFGHVRLRGEISGYRGPHSSGHAYFCLKDRDARIDAVIWKSAFGRMRFRPQEGLEVVAIGRITTFPGKSTYQIVVEQLEPAGIGALMALLEERRRRLTAEGLFAEARKRRPPFLPRVVGVVTSPTGAVIRDILHRLEDRFPRHVLVWPVRVQGETCAEEVAAAIRGFGALSPDGPVPRPDVLIVARGGGSLEDLWGFNEEAVVRAAAESPIPLISAVGHETDWTLIDHAADLRAPTPTGAAEMAVPVRAELVVQVGGAARRQEEAMLRLIESRRTELRSAARALPSPEALVGVPRQRLDLAWAKLAPGLLANAREHERELRRASDRLARQAPYVRLAEVRTRLKAVGDKPRDHLARAIAERRKALAGFSARLAAGRDAVIRAERLRIETCRERVGGLAGRADRAARAAIERGVRRLESQAGLLASLGYRSVLARGYALVRDERDGVVRTAAEVVPGQALTIEFADGRRRVQAEGARPKRRPDPLVQTSLFDN